MHFSEELLIEFLLVVGRDEIIIIEEFHIFLHFVWSLDLDLCVVAERTSMLFLLLWNIVLALESILREFWNWKRANLYTWRKRLKSWRAFQRRLFFQWTNLFFLRKRRKRKLFFGDCLIFYFLLAFVASCWHVEFVNFNNQLLSFTTWHILFCSLSQT